MKISTFDLVKKLSTEQSDLLVTVTQEQVEKIQKILLSMMEDIDLVCRENDIPYMLVGGSLLGAVRHNGFIPWDDDMDLGMTGENFKKFTVRFEEKFGDKYWVHTEKTPEYGSVIGKIRLKGSIYKGRDDLFTDECGIPIDIFRIENVSDFKIIRKLHGVLCMGMGLMLSCRLFYRNRDYYLKLANGDKEIEKIFKRKIRIGAVLKFISVTRWAKMVQGCYGACKNKRSKFVSIPSGRKHFSGEIYPREWLSSTVSHEFDGCEFPVPVNSDGYGDYMKIPAPEDRESHILIDLKMPDGV